VVELCAIGLVLAILGRQAGARRLGGHDATQVCLQGQGEGLRFVDLQLRMALGFRQWGALKGAPELLVRRLDHRVDFGLDQRRGRADQERVRSMARACRVHSHVWGWSGPTGCTCVCVCWLALCVHFCSCAAVSSATGLPAEVLRLQRQRLIAGPLGHKDWLAMHSVVLDV
jgi:hypothetical protein